VTRARYRAVTRAAPPVSRTRTEIGTAASSAAAIPPSAQSTAIARIARAMRGQTAEARAGSCSYLTIT